MEISVAEFSSTADDESVSLCTCDFFGFDLFLRSFVVVAQNTEASIKFKTKVSSFFKISEFELILGNHAHAD